MQHPRCWHCLQPLHVGRGFQFTFCNGAQREIHEECEAGTLAVIEKIYEPPTVDKPVPEVLNG